MDFKRLLCYFSVLLFFFNFSVNPLEADSSGTDRPVSSVGDLKKKGEKLFNDEKYGEAIEIYSQLLSLESQSPVYSYRYGVCLLFAGKDKSQAISYLETAVKSESSKPEA